MGGAAVAGGGVVVTGVVVVATVVVVVEVVVHGLVIVPPPEGHWYEHVCPLLELGVASGKIKDHYKSQIFRGNRQMRYMITQSKIFQSRIRNKFCELY